MKTSLPTILVGPIVRRAEAGRVVLFVAQSAETSFIAELFSVDSAADILQKRIKLDSKLNVHKVRLLANVYLVWYELIWTPRPDDQKFAYNLLFPDGTVSAFNESDGAAVSDICLPGETLPTFLVQPPQAKLRFAFGSCRKLHADVFADAGSLLLPLYSSDDSRPHALFFCGDQIYADDVSGELLKGWYRSGLISDLTAGATRSPNYLTEQELDSLPSRAAYINSAPGSQATLDPTRYKASLTGEVDDLEHHLISLAEYVCLYLVTWGPSLLNRTLSSASSPPDALLSAVNDNRVYRILMANTATYMLADDHEVTDDWLFDDLWPIVNRGLHPHADYDNEDFKAMQSWYCSDIHTGNVLRDMIMHGELCYWLFQAVGNLERNEFAAGFKRLGISSSGFVDLSPLENIAELALSFFIKSDSAENIFSFSSPSHPPVIFLDTRSQRRSFDANKQSRGLVRLKLFMERNPDTRRMEVELSEKPVSRRQGRLLTQKQVDWLARHLSSDGMAVVVTPSPVFLPPLAESFSARKPLQYDHESWSSNPDDLVDLFETVTKSGVRELLVLSGDVHFAYRANATIETRYGECLVSQYVSSGLKNRNNRFGSWMEQRIGMKFSYLSLVPGIRDRVDGLISLTEHDLNGNDASHAEIQRVLTKIADLMPSTQIPESSPFYKELPKIFNPSLTYLAIFHPIRNGERRLMIKHNVAVATVSDSSLKDVCVDWLVSGYSMVRTEPANPLHGKFR